MKRRIFIFLICIMILLAAVSGCKKKGVSDFNPGEVDSETVESVSETDSDTDGTTEEETTDEISVTSESESATLNETEPSTQEQTEATTEIPTVAPTVPPTEAPTEAPTEPPVTVDSILAGMTVEEKVYQMFILKPENLTQTNMVTGFDDVFETELNKYPVGGIIMMTANIVDPEQIKLMLEEISESSYNRTGLLPFLCVDEEGGRVARIANNDAFDVVNVGNMCDILSGAEAYSAGVTIGTYLAELGFNFDFAPVADVLTNEENTVVRYRSFGSNPITVREYAMQVSKGLQSQGIMSCYKHFPGHGATSGDTHDGFAYTDKTYAELVQSEIVPFAAAQETGVDAVMVAHISLPNVVGDETPASLSSVIITDILRGDLQYDGLVITDALGMQAICNNYSSAEAAIMAVDAGADILLSPKDFREASAAIIEAVKSGRISEQRIDESVRRIIKAKLAL